MPAMHSPISTMPAMKASSARPTNTGRRTTKSTAISARKPNRRARKLVGVRASSQRLCDFDLAPTLGQAFVEMAGIVAEELVDFSRRQTGQATAQGVQKLSFGHLSTPTIFAAGAALVSDRTLATAATKPFHSTFCAIRAAWPALVS